jgi:hypothetical protein
MRLLNTTTLQLELFANGPKKSYAILSHTWEDGEVSYQDLLSGRCHGLKGWIKITACCAKARSEGYEYVWIDTCCIDKSSSAELSEAINSMFKWYQDAEVCYAYLADVDACVERRDPFPISWSESFRDDVICAMESRWFTRGWTLQELLAPVELVFLSKSWEEIGTRDELAAIVAGITGIKWSALDNYGTWGLYSVAQRMSWAASRQTTRIEDEAYCLMGLFGVNMPLLYGEGTKAFKRLQVEIMKEGYDPSILAWATVDSFATIVGVLASSPAAFEGCGELDYRSRLGVQRGVGDYGSSKNCHEIIGSSLKMETLVICVREEDVINIRTHPEHSMFRWATAKKGSTRAVALQSLVHFPKQGSYTLAPDFFEFPYLRHKKHSIVLALLTGCQDLHGFTVGITLCLDSDGLLKRVHYPTRFLVGKTPSEWNQFHSQTLHLSLSGSQTLLKPLVPAWIRCLVRLHGLIGSTYTLSHTIPPMAVDAENCWYLSRWSEAIDRMSMTTCTQPCFSLHKPWVGRAMIFRHGTEPRYSFRLTFFIEPPTWAYYVITSWHGIYACSSSLESKSSTRLVKRRLVSTKRVIVRSFKGCRRGITRSRTDIR